MRIKFAPMLCLVLVGLCITGNSYAKGLKVSPSSYTWNNVKVGATTEFPVALEINNNSGEVRSYTLSVVKPAKLNAETAEGFKDLPSGRWISFERKQVAVGPGEWAKVKMFIRIPRKKEHFGRKWDFFVEVKEYTTPGAEMFALACYPRFYVCTEKENN